MKAGDEVGGPVEGAPLQIPFEWETIQSASFWGDKSSIQRAQVPGGWILSRGNFQMVYVPDPGWRWVPVDA